MPLPRNNAILAESSWKILSCALVVLKRDECRQLAGSMCCKCSGQDCYTAVGLPRILVDVRHEASHNELPSLALLRLAANSALTWLAHSYWQAQADHVILRKTQIVELIKVGFGLCGLCLYSVRCFCPCPLQCLPKPGSSPMGI